MKHKPYYDLDYDPDMIQTKLTNYVTKGILSLTKELLVYVTSSIPSNLPRVYVPQEYIEILIMSDPNSEKFKFREFRILRDPKNDRSIY